MKALLIIFLLLFPTVVFATTPTVTNVTGTVTTGQTLTITGANMLNDNKSAWDPFFTTNSTAYGFEGATNPQADGYNSRPVGGTYVTDVKLMGNKSVKFHSQGAWPEGPGGLGDYVAVNPTVTNGNLGDLWVRFYCRWNLNDGSWPTNYLKIMDTQGSGGARQYYMGIAGTPIGQPSQFYGEYSTVALGAHMYPYNIPGGALQNDRWYTIELHWKSTVPRSFQIWVDDVQIANAVPDVDSTVEYLLIGSINMAGTTSDFSLDAWYDGLAFGSSRIYPASTIEISNSATYHAGVYRTQEVSSLSDGSIQIKSNLTGMGSGPYFLWVTNNRQERVAVPYNLSGSGGGSDVTDPVTTANPAAGEYVTGTTIVLACSDNVACGMTYYCWGAACTPTTTYTTPVAISSPDNLILRYYSDDSSANTGTVQSSTYTILASDTTAPAISGLFPFSTLTWGTTSTTMQAHTDENATCKYGTTDVAYASLTSTFTTTGGASHSQTLSGLTNGSSTTYYIDCIDGTGNSNTSRQTVTVAVSAIAPTGNLLFSESFEDANIESRGWYDNTTHGTIVAGGQSGNALQWAWTAGQTKPENGNSSRVQFTPTDELYVSFYTKFASDWRGSQQAYHPHLFMILSDLDNAANPYSGLANNYLDTYIEFLSDVGSPYEVRPQLALQDNLRVNKSNGAPPHDLTATTENRSVNYCDDPVSTGSTGDCFCYYNADGGDCLGANDIYYSSSTWAASTVDVSKNAWHHVEVYMKMNTISGSVGQSDGIMQKWIDDTLVIDHSDVIYRTNQDATKKWAQFVLGPYIGDTSPITQTMWIDELEIYDGLPGTDNYPPSVTVLTTPASIFGMVATISAFEGTDDIGVAEYCITEVNSSAGCSWVGTAPTSHTFLRSGSRTLYGWTRDAAAQVSSPMSAPITVTRPSAAGASFQ